MVIHRKKGFTLLEVVISMAILAGLAAISVASFVSFEKRESLDASVSAIAAGLRDARTRTMASINGLQYGVMVDSDKFTLFQVPYVAGASTNQIFTLSSHIKASSTHNSFIFSKISGNSSASGTIDVYVGSDPAVKKSVSVQNTGLISTQ